MRRADIGMIGAILAAAAASYSVPAAKNRRHIPVEDKHESRQVRRAAERKVRKMARKKEKKR